MRACVFPAKKRRCMQHAGAVLAEGMEVLAGRALGGRVAARGVAGIARRHHAWCRARRRSLSPEANNDMKDVLDAFAFGG